MKSSSSEFFNNWSVISSGGSITKELENMNIALILEQIKTLPITLKDDKRSLVKRGVLFETNIVAKQPRDKNRRKWMRFLSLFRQSEAVSALNTLKKFSTNDIASVIPIAAMEQRRYGMVTDSWLIYEYREGTPSTIKNLPAVIDELKKLHRHGFRHDDPNFGNFLLDDSNQLFLIDCKGKKRLGYFSDCFDYLLLSLRNHGTDINEVIKLADIKTHSFGFQLARFFYGYKQLRFRLKNFIKQRKN